MRSSRKLCPVRDQDLKHPDKKIALFVLATGKLHASPQKYAILLDCAVGITQSSRWIGSGARCCIWISQASNQLVVPQQHCKLLR